MLLLHWLFPFLFFYVQADTNHLHLQRDVAKDVAKLEQHGRYFISDNSSLSPSVEDVYEDLQLFALVANINLSQAQYTAQQLGQHYVQQWTFPEGDIRRITQAQSNVALDTVVTQRYLEKRPPTQRRITNDFTFRSYLIDTASEPGKLFYLTENEQGLLAYRLGEKQVEINYSNKKEGLVDVLPKYRKQVENLLQQLSLASENKK